ncbi:hypothetical protein [Melittangium boletus]|uniref:Lipoprotein n=1 Tax=Melittangium boletus DSM 14713 TaxID=1294270 RepID=A0A250I6G9_9BACT|nr:hypothetical protein [Melittangium boletus]ATB26790.1 hypothetical protein MEBOL_000224 [Melittangium boletus DSM 14713]
MDTLKQRLLAATLALSSLAGCATVPRLQLCEAEVTPRKRSFPTPETWFALLLHGFDEKQGVAPRPSVDCSGAPVAWEEPAADECVEAGPQPMPLPPKERLTEEDLVLETIQANQRLAWIITRRFSNGEGLGPVAMVETTKRGFTVRALGSLRGMTQNARLRMEHVGNTDLLVAEGDACTQQEPVVCRRAARILPLRGGRFFSEAVSGADRTCLGAAWFPLSQEQVLELPNGWRRKFELTSTLTFGADAITIQEQVAVSDSDPKQPSIPERLFRRAQNERKLKVEDNVLEGTVPSLWIRMVGQQLAAGAKPLPDKPTVSQDEKATGYVKKPDALLKSDKVTAQDQP